MKCLYFQRTIPNSGFSKGNPGPSANDTMAVQKEVSCQDMDTISNLPVWPYYISQLCYFHREKVRWHSCNEIMPFCMERAGDLSLWIIHCRAFLPWQVRALRAYVHGRDAQLCKCIQHSDATARKLDLGKGVYIMCTAVISVIQKPEFVTATGEYNIIFMCTWSLEDTLHYLLSMVKVTTRWNVLLM